DQGDAVRDRIVAETGRLGEDQDAEPLGRGWKGRRVPSHSQGEGQRNQDEGQKPGWTSHRSLLSYLTRRLQGRYHTSLPRIVLFYSQDNAVQRTARRRRPGCPINSRSVCRRT